MPLLRQALASAQALGGDDLDVEMIVVDAAPASDPAVAEIANAFGARLLELPGAGAAAARNVGMRAARGEFLLFLDDDDVLLPDHVRPHLRLLRARPEVAAVFGQARLASHDLQHIGAPYPEEMGDPFGDLLARPLQIATLVARTSVRETVGELDEALPSSEDWDWELRLALAHEVAFVPVPCLLFRQRPLGTDDQLNRMRRQELRRVFRRNVWRAGRRRPSPPALARMLIRHDGLFASHFMASVRAHERAGDSRAARYAFRSALMSSPLHLAWNLLRQPELRRAVGRAHLPSRAGSAS